MHRPRQSFILVIGLALVAGVFAGRALNDFLAISIRDKTLPGPYRTEVSGSFSALPLRIVDLGGVGIVPDSANWGHNYSHTDRRFESVFITTEPFIDTTAFAAVFTQYVDYVDRMAGLGFNAIEIPGFLQLVNFDRVGSGDEVYAEDSIFRKRHLAQIPYYMKFFDYAEKRGMQVVLNTDMVALTYPLEDYLRRRFGTIDVDDDAFWDVYRRGLDELFDRLPMAAGIIIRIGEAGAVYNRPDWDYRSELWVRSVESVQKMLAAFLEVAEKHDRYIIFRTWSVGVGAVGHMHTDPQAYDQVLGGIASDRLIVSTKLTRGDFWNHLPLNPTLFTGRHKRIIELQDRREFEAFNVIPNFVSPLHQVALTRFMEANPHIVGVWAWTQTGGPLRHGPLLLYPFHGFWLWTDANVYATARIVAHPDVSIESVANDWAAMHFGDDPEVTTTISQILMHSHETAIKGLTIPAFARKEVRGLGLEVPPVIYSYWDIVGTSSAVMSHVYVVVQDDVKAAVRESFEAVDEVRAMQAAMDEIVDRIETDREWIPDMRASLAYEENLFETMAQHKAFLMYFYEWLEKGGRDVRERWEEALPRYERARDVHYAKYKGNLTFPSYNFEIADAGALHAHRTTTVVWFSRFYLLFLVGSAGWMALSERWKKPVMSGIERAGWVLYLLVLVAGSYGAFTSFEGPVFALTTGIPLLLYLLGLRFLLYKNASSRTYVRAIGPLIVLLGFSMTFLTIRGPYYFWLHFWTDNVFRMVLLVATLVLLAMHGYLVVRATSETGGALRRWGLLLILIGAPTLLYAAVNQSVGFERMLALQNDELLVLPGMLSRVLGITTHLNIPPETPLYLLGIGGFLFVAGGILMGVLEKKRAMP